MNIKKFQSGLPISASILLLINFILIFLICLIKGQLSITSYIIGMFYAAIANIVIGALALYGSFQSRGTNQLINAHLYYKKTSDEMFKEEMRNRYKAVSFTTVLVVTGLIILMIYMVLKRLYP